MSMDIQQALKLGQFVDVAYNPVAGPPLGFALPFGYQLVDVIDGNDLATDLQQLKSIVPFGFIAKAPGPANDYVVAIRGTEGIWEWIQDARFLRIPCPFGSTIGETDDGFSAVYMSLSISGSGLRVVDRLRSLLSVAPGTTLSITGHSLGAALATMLALDVVESGAFTTPACITFASPLVGDAQFAGTFNRLVPNSWRIANFVDIVTQVPLPTFWGYHHVDSIYPVNSFGRVKLVPLCAHTLSTYMYLLDSSAGGATFPIRADCK